MRSAGLLYKVLIVSVALLLAGCEKEDTVAEARGFQAAGDDAASIELLVPHLQSHPEDAEAHYLYGAALTRLSRPSEAQWPLREAMRDPEWLVDAGLVLANNAIVTQNYHTALQAANEVLEVEPDNIMALQQRASAHIVSRRGYEEALEDADHIIDLEPDHRDAGVLRAIALLGLYRVEEAEAQLEETAARGGDVAPMLAANYCVAMVDFFVENENPEKAASQLERCLAEHPDNIRVVSRALEYYETEGDVDAGLDLLRRTLEDLPRDPLVRYALASRLYANGKAEEAEALMLAAVDFQPGAASVPARLELHSYYAEIGASEKAADTLEEALELLGDEAPARLQLALVERWVGLGRFEDARELAGEIADPAHRAFGEGYVAVFSDDPALALERYSEGYRTWPDNAPARYYGAYAAEQLGRFDRAVEEYRYSIRADPGATDARYRLAELLRREGSITQALETLVIDIEKNPLGEDGRLLSIELAARLGRPDFVRSQLTSIQSTPGLRGRGIASAARGIAAGSTIEAAIRFVEESKLDAADPRESELLRVVVMLYARVGRFEDAVALVDRAVAAAPGRAEPYAIRGLLVEGFGTNPERAERAYARAVELDAEHARALAGLGRLADRAGEKARAIELLAAANAAGPEDEGIGRSHAAMLIESGREEEAARVLELHLREHPLDGVAALALGQLREQTTPADDRTLELARRATRFAGSEPAYALLARCLAARGDEQGAQHARVRAEAYRKAVGEIDPG